MTKPFISVIVKPTLSCNMGCRHCYHRPDECGSEKLSLERFEKLVSMLKEEYKSCRFIWHGGEPLLCDESFFKKAIDIEKKYFGKKYGCDNTIQTNGTLLNIGFIEFCKKNYINLGISYEGGFDADIRPGTDVQKMDSTIRYVVDKKHMFLISATIHNGNVDSMKDIYHKFRDMGATVAFSPVIRSGLASDNNISLDVDRYIANSIELFEEWIHEKDVKVPLLPFYQYILNSIYGPNISDCPHASCLTNWICLYPNGDLYPCGKACPKEFCLGNIDEIDSIDDAFQSKGFEKMLLGSIERREGCKECQIFDYCNGGCSIDALCDGDMTARGDISCRYYKEVFTHIKRTLDEIQNTKPDLSQYNGYIRDAIMGKLINPQVIDSASFQ